MARRKLKITPVLITLNVLILIIIVLFYSTRLIKYYLKENGKKDPTSDIVLLYDTLEKKQSYVDLTNGLIYDEENEIYKYVGKVDDNYLYYSGVMFRILGIDKENNIKAVTDKSVTLLHSGLEKGYNDSIVNKWLNSSDEDSSGVFENNLRNTEMLANTYLCMDNIDDLSNITCEKEENSNKIALLSLSDYANAKGKESYLNNGETFYLSTINSENKNYYITSSGEVGLNEVTTKLYGVRPVISISGITKLLKGEGTKENPYIIEEHDVKTLADVNIGDKIKYSDNIFKVVDISSENIKVALDGVIEEDKKPVEIKFGSTSKYSNSKNTVGYYLNNDYYSSLKGDGIVKSKWYIGTLSLDNLDYADIMSDSVSLNVGMLTLGDLFINDINNTFTLYRGIEESSIINVIDSEGHIYGDFSNEKYNVRPSIYLKGSLKVTSGLGTDKSPYVIGVDE